jgi:hypothetical protein|mmetsp:Transcript_39104/g.51144  ORF Transcript_39104/g.51144 Transcript_39104/m.51144 type:complete len:81 (-) Transcript_39104:172-414(-)
MNSQDEAKKSVETMDTSMDAVTQKITYSVKNASEDVKLPALSDGDNSPFDDLQNVEDDSSGAMTSAMAASATLALSSFIF